MENLDKLYSPYVLLQKKYGVETPAAPYKPYFHVDLYGWGESLFVSLVPMMATFLVCMVYMIATSGDTPPETAPAYLFIGPAIGFMLSAIVIKFSKVPLKLSQHLKFKKKLKRYLSYKADLELFTQRRQTLEYLRTYRNEN